jgi:hypothetical protein
MSEGREELNIIFIVCMILSASSFPLPSLLLCIVKGGATIRAARVTDKPTKHLFA